MTSTRLRMASIPRAPAHIAMRFLGSPGTQAVIRQTATSSTVPSAKPVAPPATAPHAPQKLAPTAARKTVSKHVIKKAPDNCLNDDVHAQAVVLVEARLCTYRAV